MSCRGICTRIKSTPTKDDSYLSGNRFYCSMCEKYFIRKDTDIKRVRCICCSVKLRTRMRRSSKEKKARKVLRI